MAADQDFGIGRLPDMLAGMTAEVNDGSLAVNAKLAKKAMPSLVRGVDPDYPVIGTINLGLSFGLIQRKELRFLFSKRAGTNPIMQTDVTMTMEPTPLDIQPAQPEKQSVFRLVIPPLIRQGLSIAERARFLTELSGLTVQQQADALFLALGPNRRDTLTVAVLNPKALKPRARFQWTSASGDSYEIKPDRDGYYPLAPFVALIQAMAGWVAGQQQGGNIVPLKVDTGSDANSIDLALHHLALSWSASSQALEPPATKPLIAELLQRYRLAAYNANLLLRLDERGDLTQADQGEVFQFGLRMQRIDDDAVPHFQITLSVPDFLVEADLRDNLTAPFLTSNRVANALVRRIRHFNRSLSVDRSSLRDFLRRSQNRSIIFRTSREREEDLRWSRDIFVYRGTLNDQDFLLIFEAMVRKKSVDVTAGEAQFKVRRLFMEVLYAGPADVRGARGLNDETVRYVARLSRALQIWLKKIQS